MLILVVDDDPAVLEGVAALLEQAGYPAARAAGATEALELLDGPDRPDLVVLDVMLPDGDGYTICRHIRRQRPYIPVLMLSARDETSDKVAGLELGADEYVTKPFEPRELLARVRAMLRFARQRADAEGGEAPLERGLLRMWRAQHRVELAGRPLELTPKEWALLELLLEHPARVFGRETLLRRVWGDDFAGDTHTVDVHVQRLRAKLGPAAWVVQTVRGFGYRLAAEGAETP